MIPKVPGSLWFNGMHFINISSAKLYSKFFHRREKRWERQKEGFSSLENHPTINNNEDRFRPPRVSKETLEARKVNYDS